MAIKIKNKGNNEPEEQEEGGQQGVPPAGSPGSGLDGFERVTFTAAAWIEDNRSLFFAMIGAVAIAVLAIILGIVYVRGQQVEASDRLSEGLASFEYVVEGDPYLEYLQTQEQVTRMPDTVFETNEDKWQTIYASAEHTLEDFDRGPIAVSARMAKAAAAFNLGEYDEAETLYREVIASEDASQEFEGFAQMGLANSLALQGDLDGAETAWQAFAELQPEREAYAKFEIARMIERYGEADEARERYEQFLEEFPDSQYRQEAERRQALL